MPQSFLHASRKTSVEQHRAMHAPCNGKPPAETSLHDAGGRVMRAHPCTGSPAVVLRHEWDHVVLVDSCGRPNISMPCISNLTPPIVGQVGNCASTTK